MVKSHTSISRRYFRTLDIFDKEKPQKNLVCLFTTNNSKGGEKSHQHIGEILFEKLRRVEVLARQRRVKMHFDGFDEVIYETENWLRFTSTMQACLIRLQP